MYEGPCIEGKYFKILRKLGRVKEAEELHKESLKIDPLYDRQPEKINHNTLLELVIDLYEAGDYAQGITLAEKWVKTTECITARGYLSAGILLYCLRIPEPA